MDAKCQMTTEQMEEQIEECRKEIQRYCMDDRRSLTMFALMGILASGASRGTTEERKAIAITAVELAHETFAEMIRPMLITGQLFTGKENGKP